MTNIPKELAAPQPVTVEKVDTKHNSMVVIENGIYTQVNINKNTSIKGADTNIPLKAIRPGDVVIVHGEPLSQVNPPHPVVVPPVSSTPSISVTKTLKPTTATSPTQNTQPSISVSPTIKSQSVISIPSTHTSLPESISTITVKITTPLLSQKLFKAHQLELLRKSSQKVYR